MSDILETIRRKAGRCANRCFKGCHDDKNPTISLVNGIKPAIFIGRLLMLFPHNDLIQAKTQSEEYNLNFGVWRSLFMLIFLFVNFVLQTNYNFHLLNSISGTFYKIDQLKLTLYTFTTFYVYFRLFRSDGKLKSLIDNLIDLNNQPKLIGNEISEDLQKIEEKATRETHPIFCFPRFCLVILTFIMIGGITEHLFFDVQKVMNTNKGNTILEKYYNHNLIHWNDLFSGTNSIAVVVFFSLQKISCYGWMFSDGLVIILCRAVSLLIEKFNMQLADVIAQRSQVNQIATIFKQSLSCKGSPYMSKDTETAQDVSCDIRDRFLELKELITNTGSLVAPLILVCYAFNVTLIIINLFVWIVPNVAHSAEQTVYSVYSFSIFAFRVWLVTYFAANVNYSANQLCLTLEKCPNHLYTITMDRIERSINSNPVGINLYGTVTITRQFFISIMSFIFTVEIVLLQTTK